MAEACEIPTGSYTLKLGSTFSIHANDTSYHTLRFDFKPKSLACEKDTYIGFGGGGDVQIAVHNNDDDSLTIYKGSQKPVKAFKECLLFFDHTSGEFRLEKLSTVISVKKTRDTGESDVSQLRVEIDKLRQKNELSTAMNGKSITNSSKRSRSSSSSSSSSSNSESEDSDESSARILNNRVATDSSPSSSDGGSSGKSSGDDDDDDDDDDDALETALEQLNNNHFMDAVENSSKNDASSILNHQNNSKKILHDDLHLSESSDED
ncbi:unnamed protein product [Dracunculus medinensis]|uniref:Ell-associated factor Eaf n=1 Tax=Dracunculus medinensis TaxID=318479 RepID=A0A0N4UCW6_DRAME|nr:unnamed protein product [Dracunculus medinensis]